VSVGAMAGEAEPARERAAWIGVGFSRVVSGALALVRKRHAEGRGLLRIAQSMPYFMNVYSNHDL